MRELMPMTHLVNHTIVYRWKDRLGDKGNTRPLGWGIDSLSIQPWAGWHPLSWVPWGGRLSGEGNGRERRLGAVDPG